MRRSIWFSIWFSGCVNEYVVHDDAGAAVSSSDAQDTSGRTTDEILDLGASDGHTSEPEGGETDTTTSSESTSADTATTGSGETDTTTTGGGETDITTTGGGETDTTTTGGGETITTTTGDSTESRSARGVDIAREHDYEIAAICRAIREEARAAGVRNVTFSPGEVTGNARENAAQQTVAADE